MSVPIQPGFSPQFKKRIESIMTQKAQQFPTLPPDLAAQFSNGLMLAAQQGQLFNMEIAFGTLEAPVIVKVLMFQEKNKGVSVQQETKEEKEKEDSKLCNINQDQP